MSVTYVHCSTSEGRSHNYHIGGTTVNAFVIGEVGAEDDFWLVGAEPPEGSPYPLLTGNILGSDGTPLFKLVRNVITINPGDCSRILSQGTGYEICYPKNADEADHLIFRINTVLDITPDKPYSQNTKYVTTLNGNFYNNKGDLVFAAHAGTDEHIETSTKHALGFSGSFGFTGGMSQEDLEFAGLVLQSNGAIHQRMSGAIENQRFTLDGKAIYDAAIKNCDIDIFTGDFAIRAGAHFDTCRFHFQGVAGNVHALALMLAARL